MIDYNRNIETVLGTEEDRFYVYALCERLDNGKVRPFYIGKGEKGRMWQHEEETDAAYARVYKREYSEEDVRKELTEKRKKIKSLQGKGKLERIIIKWGLNEREAFMAESALINLLNYEGYNELTLTNIVNGHASQREKNSLIHTTKAMTAEAFHDACCMDAISFEEVRGKVIFININKFFQKAAKEKPENQKQALCDITRGCWRIKKGQKPQFILAVYDSTICGIYRCTATNTMFDLSDYPQYPTDIRDKEKELLQLKVNSWDEMKKEYQEKYKRFLFILDGSEKEHQKKVNSAINDRKKKEIQTSEDYYRCSYQAWLERAYFSCEEAEDSAVILKNRNGEALYAKDLRGRVILRTEEEKSKSIFVQNPVRYPLKD